MGGNSFTDYDYSKALKDHVPDLTSVTKKAEQVAKKTGKLNPQVDPASDGVIRRSKPRFEKIEGSDFWRLAVKMPMPIETRLDTTGSMGGNVDKALKVLPELYSLCSEVLPNYSLQLSTGIFGDVQDNFVLCRPKFADSADRLVERLTLMVPERAGGDTAEDPQYGLFGAAYLTDARINKYGLKYYDFTVSDAWARDHLLQDQIIRIFGSDVFEKVAENGHNIDKSDLPTTKEVVSYLLRYAHAFFLQVGRDSDTKIFWERIYGAERVIVLDDIDYLPIVQALIVGFSEGSLTMSSAADFLGRSGMNSSRASELVRSVAHIPIGAQLNLVSSMAKPIPNVGDYFKERTDIWPIDVDINIEKDNSSNETEPKKVEWL